VYIDNSVGGYTPATEDLYYTVYYTDGSVTGPVDVDGTTIALQNALRGDPNVPSVAQGGKYFEIDAAQGKQIDAVQLTMGEGKVKIPVIQFSIENVFSPQALSMGLTATLSDKDGDTHQDTFSVALA
jgi:hypothetical protein